MHTINCNKINWKSEKHSIPLALAQRRVSAVYIQNVYNAFIRMMLNDDGLEYGINVYKFRLLYI